MENEQLAIMFERIVKNFLKLAFLCLALGFVFYFISIYLGDGIGICLIGIITVFMFLFSGKIRKKNG